MPKVVLHHGQPSPPARPRDLLHQPRPTRLDDDVEGTVDRRHQPGRRVGRRRGEDELGVLLTHGEPGLADVVVALSAAGVRAAPGRRPAGIQVRDGDGHGVDGQQQRQRPRPRSRPPEHPVEEGVAEDPLRVDPVPQGSEVAESGDASASARHPSRTACPGAAAPRGTSTSSISRTARRTATSSRSQVKCSPTVSRPYAPLSQRSSRATVRISATLSRGRKRGDSRRRRSMASSASLAGHEVLRLQLLAEARRERHPEVRSRSSQAGDPALLRHRLRPRRRACAAPRSPPRCRTTRGAVLPHPVLEPQLLDHVAEPGEDADAVRRGGDLVERL